MQSLDGEAARYSLLTLVSARYRSRFRIGSALNGVAGTDPGALPQAVTFRAFALSDQVDQANPAVNKSTSELNSRQDDVHMVAVIKGSAHQPGGNKLFIVEIDDGVRVCLLDEFY